MNRDTHCDSSGVRHQKLQQIATKGALLFAYLLAAGRTSAQTGKPSAEKQAKIETAISKSMAASKVPGISAAVVENGEFVWSAGFGMADLENFVPATSETLYRLGSISKPITSTAAMQLWERGKPDLDSRAEVLPGIPAEAVAHHHAGTARASRRNPALQLRVANRPRKRQHTSLRKWNRSRPEVFRKRPAGCTAWNSFSLLHARLHSGRIRYRGSIRREVRGLGAREYSRSGRDAANAC
jgi:CubicO group peptidase (beta-lactamase class C family)